MATSPRVIVQVDLLGMDFGPDGAVLIEGLRYAGLLSMRADGKMDLYSPKGQSGAVWALQVAQTFRGLGFKVEVFNG